MDNPVDSISMVYTSDTETNESETGGRQALLYCSTTNGKAVRMPVVITMPESGKYSERKQCICHAIAEAELYPDNEVILDKLYIVNKNSRSLSLITVTGDSGIQQINLEYPEKQKNRRLSTSRIKLACDWHQKGKSWGNNLIYKNQYVNYTFI